jgi:hypothetical protein
VDEERFSGSGYVFVADGYGLGRVHRFNKQGHRLGSFDGTGGGGAPASLTPHAVFIDRRRGPPELYVADRGNKRVLVYDLDCGYSCAFGADFLTSPSGLAALGDLLVIAELRARLAVVDGRDGLVDHLGDNEQVCKTVGWPNMKDPRGKVLPTALLVPGRFNSPHGLAVDASGSLYISEWLICGRTVKLLKL